MTAPCPRKPSFVSLFPVCMLPLDSFIPTTMLYTLINKFVLFLRFFRVLAYSSILQSLSSAITTIPFFALQSLSPYPVLFLTAITNSHPTIHPSRRASTSRTFCHPFSLTSSFRSPGRPFSLMSKPGAHSPSFLSRTCSPSQTLCSRSCIREQNPR